MKSQQQAHEARDSIWGWVLVGWLAGGTVMAWAAHGVATSAEAFAAAQRAPINWDLARMSPRQLRTLPGIGSKRAAEIAEHRWEKKLDDQSTKPIETNIQAIQGIGPKIDLSVRRFINRQNTQDSVPLTLLSPANSHSKSSRCRYP